MVIDESHLVCDEVLESIRLLNNLEEGAVKLLQIILLGQQELMIRLASPDMENFRQRIAGLEQIGTMDTHRLREYILHRLTVAGAKGEIFTAQALEAICLSTGGVPRRTNSLCDRALRLAYEEGKTLVDTEAVHRAALALGMGRQTMHYIVGLRSEEVQETEEAAEQAASSPPPEKEKAPLFPAEGETVVTGAGVTRRGLALPLSLFGLSLLSLAGSFAFYCSRSPATTPAACLASLLEKIF